MLRLCTKISCREENKLNNRPIELLVFNDNPPGGGNAAKRAISHLKYDGKLFVYYRQDHVQNFPSLPLVISSKAEGWRVEARILLDKRMRNPDIVTRLPVSIETDSPGESQKISTPYRTSLLEIRRRS